MMKTQSLYQETANVASGWCPSSSPSPFGSMITMIRDPNSISHHEHVALALKLALDFAPNLSHYRVLYQLVWFG